MTNFMAIGHITRDAQTRTVNIGNVPTLVTDFTLAVNDGYDSATGNSRYTNFYKVTIWRDRGAKLAPHLKKGRCVTVKGVPSATAWINNDGKAMPQLEIKDAQVELEGKKPGDPDELPFDAEEGIPA